MRKPFPHNVYLCLHLSASTLSTIVLHICALLVVACSIATGISCQAQANSYLYDWVPGPNSNPAPVDYGYVQQSDGHLHLEIPIGEAHHNRSGSGTTQVRLVYDSNFWNPNNFAGTTYAWEPGESWHLLPGYTSYSYGGYPEQEYYEASDVNGVTHDFPCSASCYSTEGKGYWLDASGWQVYGPDGSAIITNSSIYSGIVSDANGNYTTLQDGRNEGPYSSVYGVFTPYDTSNIPLMYAYSVNPSGETLNAPGPYQDGLYYVPSMSSAGGTEEYIEHAVTIEVNSAFHEQRYPVGECVNSASSTCNTQVLSQLILPDETSFTFKYDCDSTIAAQRSYCNSPGGQPAYYGGLTQMITPTGGIYTYSYQPFVDVYDDATLGLLTLSNGYGTWHYSEAALSQCGGPSGNGTWNVGCEQTVTTVEPNGRTKVTTNIMNLVPWPISELVTDGAGHNLSLTTTQWDFSQANLWYGYGAAYVHKQWETETLWDTTGAAQTRKTAYTYDSPQKGNVTVLQRWGYSPGTNPSFAPIADVTTYNTYYSPLNSPLADSTLSGIPAGGTNVIDKPLSTTVCNSVGTDPACPGGGTRVSQTLITYDQYGSSGLSSITGVANHDDVSYGSTQLVRGNPTSVSQWVVGSQYVTQSMTYDTTGQVVSVKDGDGNLTQYDYTDNYYVDNGTSSPAAYTPSTVTHAHATTVTKPSVRGQAFTLKTGYYYGDQKPAFTTDFNNNSTYYHYTDPLDRVTETIYPLGWLVNQYTSPTEKDVYRSQAISGTTPSVACTGCLHTSTTLDGLARVVETISADGSKVDTKYNAMGLVQSVSNPYQTTADATYGLTSYVYDILDRLCLLNNPDNNLTQVASCTAKGSSAQEFSYVVNGGYKTDENGNTWKYLYDPLGRLASVTEPNGAVTQYINDVLGNLTSVSQAGLSSNGETPRSRGFTYDGLSRLLTSTNPESGTICYGNWSGSSCTGGYDGNGNLVAKTDARGVTTSFTYDALNRLQLKTYSGVPAAVASTPPSTFVYDTNNGTAVPNAIGRLVSEVTGPVNAPVTQRSIVAYDPMGRIKEEKQCGVATICGASPYDFQYAYDLAGDLSYASNGVFNTGIGLNYSYDGAGRLQTVRSTWNDPVHPETLFAPPASGAQYNPAGGLSSASFGIPSSSQQATYTEQKTYDDRLRATSETDIGNTLVYNPASPPPATVSTGSIVIKGTENSTGAAVQATGNISISGTEGSHQVCITGPTPPAVPGQPPPKPVQKCNTVYDTGTLSVNIDGYTATATYGLGSKDSTIVSALVAALNGPNSPVTALPIVAGGNSLIMTSIASGPGADYPFSVTNGADFSGSVSGATLTGGASPTFDSGTITVNINGSAVGYSWGSGSTATSIAIGLAAAINVQDSNFLSAGVSSGTTAQGTTTQSTTIQLTSTQSGTSTNWAISCAVGDNSGVFTSSFTAACNGMSGGTNATSGPPPVYTPTTVYSYTIPIGGYAANSDLVAVSDSVMGNWSYSYDSLNRLTKAQASANQQTGFAPYAAALLSWAYDSFGNYKGQTLSGSTQALVNQGSYSYTGNNQLIGFNYDPSGNLLKDAVNSYTYDAEGRLASAGTTQYLYDAEGRRVAKLNGTTPTNLYLLGLGGEQVSELDGSGKWLHTNAYAGGRLLATYDGVGLHFHFTDWLGTRRVQANAAGKVDETCQSLPFGDSLNCVGSGSDVTEHHFTGKERDTESGLDYFGARYYASSMGRFMSADWSPNIQPVPYASLGDPQSLNLYIYAGNNPLSRFDADGHNWFGDFAQGLADSTYRPLVQIVEHPIATAQGIGTAIEHPIVTGRAIGSAVVGTVEAAAHGDGRAIGQIVGTVGMAVAGGAALRGLGVAGEVGAEAGSFVGETTSVTTEETYAVRLAEAQEAYPGKAGTIENHHIAPKYLGGDPNGPTVPLDGAYHQTITNAFRNQVPYGSGPISPQQMQNVMDSVYSKLPLPPGSN